MTMTHHDRDAIGGVMTDFVTATVGGQIVGLLIAKVRDVFVPERVTRVPLAPPCVAGILNLRGRVVTAIDLRARLGLPRRTDADSTMAIGVDHDGESFGLIVDDVGDVLRLSETARDDIPVNLDRQIAALVESVYRLDDRLMVIIDIARVLDFAPDSIAA